jgi:hypothetical protein
LTSHKIMASLGLAIVLFVLGGCGNHIIPITNVRGQALPASAQQLPLPEVTRRISDAATRLHWQVAQEDPAQLRAIYTKDDHIVTVRITYSQTTYNIEFVSSINMDQDNGRIHHKYGDWLAALSAAISEGVGRAS